MDMKPGLNVRELFEDDMPTGWACECPSCGETNKALYNDAGQLVWWPDKHIGQWCVHAHGAYAGIPAHGAPQFYFR